MSAIVPFAVSSFAPEERPRQLPAKESRRTGRHEPIRSSTPGSPPAGPGSGSPGPVAAGMAFVGAWAERRHMTRIARAASGLAVQLTADGTPADEAAAWLLALKGADRVALEQAARDTAGNPETSRALGRLGRVAVLRTLP